MANGHGGARPGAGRKPGSPNKVSQQLRRKIEQNGGMTPLDFLLRLMRNPKAPKQDRMWAAEKAAPYVHARLAAVEHTGDMAPVMFNRIERVIISPRERIAERIEKLAKRTERAPVVIEGEAHSEPAVIEDEPAPIVADAPEVGREPELVDGPRIHLGGW